MDISLTRPPKTSLLRVPRCPEPCPGSSIGFITKCNTATSFLFFFFIYLSVVIIWVNSSACCFPVPRWVNGSGRSLDSLVRPVEASSPCTMSVSYLRRWLLQAVLFLAAVPSSSSDCPKPCGCSVPSEVQCTFKYLTAIPDSIEPAVERLNLGWVSDTFSGDKYHGWRFALVR